VDVTAMAIVNGWGTIEADGQFQVFGHHDVPSLRMIDGAVGGEGEVHGLVLTHAQADGRMSSIPRCGALPARVRRRKSPRSKCREESDCGMRVGWQFDRFETAKER
jgi:hypothetical protein